MQIMEKGCFACASFTRQKNIASGVLNKVVGELQFMVCGGHIILNSIIYMVPFRDIDIGETS